ncbi:LytTR family transcriptional regulator [Mitsuaria sp. WAJ17]|uniref:LytTR family DNA-binding domain-containing protein n=1 Tax=Mitsuaria sp. WAJ17 TaxID=2761452 RepID=UPI001601C1ED|nr:LytTR family DNA-binding domain-containing protein [Mitsuaria sp. WAJ17]MBB2483965.1 LytTR family transcriptional regulator [Mitsuaria sp. WAJ17]
MNTRTADQHIRKPAQGPGPGLGAGSGPVLPWAYLYWLVFLLCLEPDNVQRAWHAGNALEPAHELLRIGLAAALGTAVTPWLLYIARRQLHEGPQPRGRAAAGLVLQLLLLSAGLILAAGVLAAWVFQGRLLPRLIDLQMQLQSDGLLLTFALAGLLALIQLGHRPGGPLAPAPAPASAPAEATPASPWRTEVDVGSQGRSAVLAMDTIDWIETQGNYLALHAGTRTHLLRESMGRLEAQLDPLRFVRIHRRLVVALGRVQSLTPLGNGDAMITLADGQRLRVSRSYRRDFQARWEAPASGQGKA